MQVLALALIASGATLEALGLLGVVLAIRTDSRRIKEPDLADPGIRVAVGTAVSYSSAGQFTVKGGAPPTIEDVVAMIKRESADRDEQLLDLRRGLDAEISRLDVEARQGRHDLDRELRRLLREAIGGNPRTKWIGAIVLALGLGLGLAGGIVSLYVPSPPPATTVRAPDDSPWPESG